MARTVTAAKVGLPEPGAARSATRPMKAIRMRRTRGLSVRRGRALVTHGLRTALIPMATFFAYQFALLFVGATFTEKIYGWHGMGEFFVDSVIKNDVNAVAGVTLFVGVLVLIAGFLSDLAYAALDPRVRV